MQYLDYFHKRLTECINNDPKVVAYGENINLGSKLSGLSRCLVEEAGYHVLNVGNCELTHLGIAYGLAIADMHPVVFLKQLDFIHLGMDHLVNTERLVTLSHFDSANLSIVSYVCNQGYQGPQSSFNAAHSIASLTRIPTICLNGIPDIDFAIQRSVFFKRRAIYLISQRHTRLSLPSPEVLSTSTNELCSQHFSGGRLTVVCFNFAYLRLLEQYEEGFLRGIDIFHINYLDITPQNIIAVIDSVVKTARLVIVDDGDAENNFVYKLVSILRDRCKEFEFRLVSRCRHEYFVQNDDFFIPPELLR
jgi:pyruvate/2-oxoglutarate/acetoin dehydrogenase E1 component